MKKLRWDIVLIVLFGCVASYLMNDELIMLYIFFIAWLMM